ncbi:response regulator transcription factor [Sediminivirga luteola]|uniref:Transcriptional regulatory protein CseB n=1 Tax=Sediminivirga luteola TaxID=1774748 RepID=A0A8J2XLY4_9MICO|nr:response regulator transcription factor [Sediminivirga luteola]MCI2264541.1 response regulator transcription factor [Sediminivirga luteola]GGA25959.1 transcriptional regulatory protein CseB [Sediminivirga luteola]
MHIVLVEDDEVIRETTQIGLERLGYTVSSFADGREGYEFVAGHGADVVLLDLMLPTMNGASVCRAIREHSTVPIIVISARSDNLDIVQALDAGADDYLTKPFDMQVLSARIRAVVRRFITSGTGQLGFTPEAEPQETPAVQGAQAIIADGDDYPALLGAGGVQAPSVPPKPQMPPPGQAAAPQLNRYQTRLGPLTLDTSRLTVEVHGEEVHLTPTELRVLLLLTEEVGKVYSRDKIAYTVWGYDWAGDNRVVDVHIQRLRKKIGAEMIETVRGFGYRFAAS